MTLEELTRWLYQSWRIMRHWSRQRVLQLRSEYIDEINDEDDTSLARWPASIRVLFFRQNPPLNDRETFRLSVFFIGNGYSPYSSGLWILSVFALAPRLTRRNRIIGRRMMQFLWIHGHARSYLNVWRYYDLENRREQALEPSLYQDEPEDEESQH